MTQYDILATNVGGARRIKELKELAEKIKPDVIIATEAYYSDDFLRSIPEYRVKHYGKREGADAPSVAMLVRRKIPLKFLRLIKMDRVWWGPFTNRKRAPRRFVKGTIRKGLVWIPILACHFPPGGPGGGRDGRNRKAWAEAAAFAVSWLRTRKRGVVVGDLNSLAGEARAFIAEPADAKLIAGGKVTHSVTVGMRGTADVKNAPEGMHGWVHFTLRTK